MAELIWGECELILELQGLQPIFARLGHTLFWQQFVPCVLGEFTFLLVHFFPFSHSLVLQPVVSGRGSQIVVCVLHAEFYQHIHDVHALSFMMVLYI